VGDDICWMKFDDSGQLRAINPEAGFFGVAPGTSMKSNPNAMRTLHSNCIYTNCALTPDGDIWWEDMTDEPPAELLSWKREKWTPDSGVKAANPNARYTAPARQCPVMDPAWEDPAGVPISAILFGGRRPATVPLCFEAPSWQYGTFLGTIQASETTAAAAGSVGVLRYDPMAMLPFCGYNMGDYFAHWLSMPGRAPNARMPRIFFVNWFRKGEDGRFLWPGFGDNSRVLKWIFERVEGAADAVESPIGLLPAPGAIDTAGLNVPDADMAELLSVDAGAWLQDLPAIRAHYAKFGDAIPAILRKELDDLEARLQAAAR
jgi:phosphoenolpyruvate carboxykinase (GTP)